MLLFAERRWRPHQSQTILIGSVRACEGVLTPHFALFPCAGRPAGSRTEKERRAFSRAVARDYQPICLSSQGQRIGVNSRKSQSLESFNGRWVLGSVDYP